LELAGKLFQGIGNKLKTRGESASGEAIKQHATGLAKRIVRVVEEPEPIYREKLSPEKMAELEPPISIFLSKKVILKKGVVKVLDLSDRDAARVLNKMESLETSDIFQLHSLLEEKRETMNQNPLLRITSQNWNYD